MQCAESEYHRRPVIVTRSGYTGEVGFELFTYQDIAGRPVERPARGDGAVRWACRAVSPPRDVLRLEMGYPLYGQDLFESSTALEAGLGWAVAFDKGEFRGRAALLRQRDEGPPSRLRGLLMDERRHIPRAHYPVFVGDQLIGEVTSGTFSPTLQRGIALRLPVAGRRRRRWDPRSRWTSGAAGAGRRSCGRRSWIAALADRSEVRPCRWPLANRIDEIAGSACRRSRVGDQPLERPAGRPAVTKHRHDDVQPGRARCPAGAPGRSPAPRRSTPTG